MGESGGREGGREGGGEDKVVPGHFKRLPYLTLYISS